MSKYHSHISSAVKIIEAYKGEEPFVHFIRKFFAANKKYGSKDRKSISTLCYNYFRTGKALETRTTEQRIVLSLFLCSHESNELLEAVEPSLSKSIGQSFTQKLAVIELQETEVSKIFPFKDQLSDLIDQETFNRSFLIQPKLFIRVRPGRKKITEDKLAAGQVAYEQAGNDALAIKNATALDDIIAINKDAVIQDLNSQQVLDYLDEKEFPFEKGNKPTAWDCCVASGGKSILLYDKLKGKIQLTVSDIRKSILHNCEKRLQQAKVEIYKSFVADLTLKTIPDFTDQFPLIICDAPCTGSGTWSRTPEQLVFFKEPAIDGYVQKQQKIAVNALKQLQKDGLFFYITCSVFKKENEQVTEFLQKQTDCKLLQQQYYKGYEMQADTMFVAVFTK